MIKVDQSLIDEIVYRVFMLMIRISKLPLDLRVKWEL